MSGTRRSRTSNTPSRTRPGDIAPVGLALAIAASLGTAALPTIAASATIVVDSASDDSAPAHCSLRDAVAAANTFDTPSGSNCAPGDGNDLIVFAVGVSDIVFREAPDQGEDSALLIEDRLTIDGGPLLPNGQPRVTIERSNAPGTPDFRLIDADVPLTLKGIALRNGHTRIDGHGGGAVYSSAPPLTVVECVVSGNSTVGVGAVGGGISVSPLHDTNPSLVLVRSVISGNATHGEDAYGGALFASSAAIGDSTVSGNSTHGNGARGGGVAATTVRLDGSRVADNTTYGRSAHGGGVFAGSTITTNATTGAPTTTITGNRTLGDFAVGGGMSSLNMDLYTTRIIGNSTSGEHSRGGGIDGVHVDLGRSVIADNVTRGDHAPGGGAYARSAQIFNSTISGNSTSALDAPGGGVMAIDLILQFSTITANRAVRGAGAYATGYAGQPPSLSAVATIIAGNSGGRDVEASDAAMSVSGDHDLFATVGIGLQLPPDTLHCNPNLLPLGDFGGDTLTHGLPGGSCAIDAGPVTGPEFDQRGPGFARPYGGSNDIGAYEAQPRPDPIFSDTFEPRALRPTRRG